MNEAAMGSRKDVTVILLGPDQANSRLRALHYYDQSGIPCMASDLPLAADVDELNERLAQQLDGLATPFVTLALNTDFVLGSALDNAALCLQAQARVVAAQGYALGYAPANDRVGYYQIGSAFPPIGEASGRARLAQYALAGQQAWRAVMRVSTLKAALAALPANLDITSWRVAISYAVLALGPVAHLDQTDVVLEHVPESPHPATREEHLSQLVRILRQWDIEQDGLCADEDSFVVLNQFVRNGYDHHAAQHIFTSEWCSVAGPERRFEPLQDVELPYYNGMLFGQLTALEFLVHAWPSSEQHRYALEGTWVRQAELLQEHSNDTGESLQHRCWQALSLGLFNVDVCQRLLTMCKAEADDARVGELTSWLERLSQVPSIGARDNLSATTSGEILSAIAAATPDAAGCQRALDHLVQHPAVQIAFIVLDLENNDQALQTTFDSLLASGLSNFKLVVLKAGKPPAITTSRNTLHFIQVSESNWVTHLNQSVRQLPSEWLMLVQAGDVLLAGGLLRLSVELVEAPACLAIAANEVQRDDEGRLHSVVRPGANLDLLRSLPGLMSRHWLVRRQVLLDLGGYSEHYREAIELDVLLRLIETHGLSSLAHMSDYLVIGQQASLAMRSEALEVVNRHLTQLGYQGQVTDHAEAGLAIDFRHGSTPLVSILVAFEGDQAQLQKCLAAVLQRTRYPRYEIIVAGGQFDIESSAAKAFAGRVRLVQAEPDASFKVLLTQAASQALGEYLVILSEHSCVVTPAWIENMLNEAQRPEVGVVGASLLRALDGTLTHAGYELLAGPEVFSPWQGLSWEQAGQQPWFSSVRSCAAVSGGCLMVRKAVFDCYPDLLEDVDISLCLSAAADGLMVIWTPRSQLLLSSVASAQSRPQSAVEALAARWPAAFHGEIQLGNEKPPRPNLEWVATLG